MCPVCNGTPLCQNCEGRRHVESWLGCNDEGLTGQGGTWCPECFDYTQHQSHGVCQHCHGIGEILDPF